MKKPVYAMCKQQRCRSVCVADHPRSLISAFVVRRLDSIIPLLAKSNISRIQLASVAEQTDLNLTWSQTPKTGFLVTRLK